jgi:hypothetical protein
MFKSTLSLLAALQETLKKDIKGQAFKADEDAGKMMSKCKKTQRVTH